ncbi:MAG: YozQ family protein [Alicyclobacillus sp.]|nr:YozQ family protein [Alicyclobacillus sp.]
MPDPFTDADRRSASPTAATRSHIPKSDAVADATYPPEPAHDDPEVTQALATTHEQIRDVYAAGTSDGILIHDGGEEVHVRRSPQGAPEARPQAPKVPRM